MSYIPLLCVREVKPRFDFPNSLLLGTYLRPKVQQKDHWSVIGGRMGYVQFPGTDTEPAKCGPVTAQQLEHIYRQYLSAFDRAYIANVLDLRLKNSQAPMQFNATQLSVMVSMADQPVHQLRAQGFSETMIQFMEAHRAHLQRMRIEREGFHDGAKPNAGDQNPQVQSNGALLNPAAIRPLFSQPGPQNTPAPHVMENRPQLAAQHAGAMMANRPGREQIQAALVFINKARHDTLASSKSLFGCNSFLCRHAIL